MGWFFVANIIITAVCFVVVSWANHYLFTYLGQAEINGTWKHCYMYHTLTIPARVVAMTLAILAIAVCVTVWYAFAGAALGMI